MLSEFVALLALATTPVDASATPIANQTAAYVETLMEPSTIEPLPAAPPPTMSNAAQTSAAIPIDAVVQAATTPDLTEIVVTGHGRKTEADPLAGVNVISYQAVQALDKVFIGPASRVYQKVLPKPARLGINNFLLNLHEPNVFLNYLIQLIQAKQLKRSVALRSIAPLALRGCLTWQSASHSNCRAVATALAIHWDIMG